MQKEMAPGWRQTMDSTAVNREAVSSPLSSKTSGRRHQSRGSTAAGVMSCWTRVSSSSSTDKVHAGHGTRQHRGALGTIANFRESRGASGPCAFSCTFGEIIHQAHSPVTGRAQAAIPSLNSRRSRLCPYADHQYRINSALLMALREEELGCFAVSAGAFERETSTQIFATISP